MSLTIAQRVANGVELLESKGYGTWYEELNLRKLVMEDCKRCVLAQLFGDFEEGVAELRNFGEKVNWAACGLDADVNDENTPFVDKNDDYDSDLEYAALDAEWIRVTEEKRKEAASFVGSELESVA